jgi:hypothetical protein
MDNSTLPSPLAAQKSSCKQGAVHLCDKLAIDVE